MLFRSADKITSIENDDIVQLNLTQTLKSKTLVDPIISGTSSLTGTLDVSGNTTVGGNLTVDDVTMSTKIHAGPAGSGGHTTSPVCSLCVSHTSDVVVADSSYTQNAMNFWQQDQTDNNWSTVVFQSGNNTVSGYGSAGRIGFQYLDHSVPGAYGRISFAGRSSNGLNWNSDILSLEYSESKFTTSLAVLGDNPTTLGGKIGRAHV